MTYTNGTVRTSSCLQYKRRTPGFEVTHLLSGKKFLISEPTKEILQLLNTPRDYALLSAELTNHYDEQEVEDILHHLHQSGMIVGELDDETFHLRKMDHRLWGLPDYKPKRQDKKQIAMVGVPFGFGNTTDQQCADFPIVLRRFSMHYMENFYPRHREIDFRFLGFPAEDFSVLRSNLENEYISDAGDLFIHKNEYASSVYEKIERLTSEIASNGDIPFIIGGDHSISYPAIKGVAGQYPKIQVLQFDAHVDTYDSKIASIYSSAGRAPHHHGNFLSKVLSLPQIDHVYQYGIRGCFNMRPKEEEKCTVFWDHELKQVASQSVSQETLDIPVYITFDIDFFNPFIAPGTATPVAGGPTYTEGIKLLRTILKNRKVVGVDFVEVNPAKDKAEQTVQLATSIMLNILNEINIV